MAGHTLLSICCCCCCSDDRSIEDDYKGGATLKALRFNDRWTFGHHRTMLLSCTYPFPTPPFSFLSFPLPLSSNPSPRPIILYSPPLQCLPFSLIPLPRPIPNCLSLTSFVSYFSSYHSVSTSVLKSNFPAIYTLQSILYGLSLLYSIWLCASAHQITQVWPSYVRDLHSHPLPTFSIIYFPALSTHSSSC